VEEEVTLKVGELFLIGKFGLLNLKESSEENWEIGKLKIRSEN